MFEVRGPYRPLFPGAFVTPGDIHVIYTEVALLFCDAV